MKTAIYFAASPGSWAYWRSSGPALAFAQAPDKGDTAWMLTSTALVLLMSVPALGACSTAASSAARTCCRCSMQVFVGFSLITVLWCVYGYSFAFTAGNAFFGSTHAAVPERRVRFGDGHVRARCDVQQSDADVRDSCSSLSRRRSRRSRAA